MPTLSVCAGGTVMTFEQTSSAAAKCGVMTMYRSTRSHAFGCADGMWTVNLRLAVTDEPVCKWVHAGDAIEWLNDSIGTIQFGSCNGATLQCNVVRANGVAAIESFSLFVRTSSAIFGPIGMLTNCE